MKSKKITVMINPAHLRIGNIVTYSSGGIDSKAWKFVTPHAFQVMDEGELTPQGILLTPQVMADLGFKHRPPGIGGADMWQGAGFWSKKDKDGFTFQLRGNVSTAKGGVLHFQEYPNAHVEFLHELQNLYYIMTRQELDVKLPTI
jgi:hypothetical protein